MKYKYIKRTRGAIITLLSLCTLLFANITVQASEWLNCYPEDWKGDKLSGNTSICVNWTKNLTWYASGYMYGILKNKFDYTPDNPTETPWIADEEGTVEDYDGNIYKTLRFGDTWWMTENLRTKTFADGTKMQKYVEWNGACDGGYSEGNTSEYMYSHANNNAANDKLYGCLYSWGVGFSTLYKKTVLLKDSGWVLPDTLDFYNLMKRFGVWKSAVLKKVQHNHEYTWELTSAPNFGLFIKSDRNTLWKLGSPRADEIPYNASGLSFPPAGQMEGTHSGFGSITTIWTALAVHATPNDGLGRRYLILNNLNNTMTTLCKGYGMARSIRLIKRIKRTKNANGTYTPTDTIAWCPGYIEGYKNTKNITAIAVNLAQKGIKIWGTHGCIMVESSKINTKISIYSISGKKIKTIMAAPGIMQIPVKQGLYIVRMNGVGKKIMVI